MDLNQLTDEQIANLTPEQMEMAETDPAGLMASLGETADTATEQSEQEVKDAANGVDEEERPVVLNKSGKGVIPYEKHQGLRVENSTLRQQLQEAQAKLDELLQNKDEATGTKDVAVADEAITRHLENLKAEMPELHSVINAVLEGSRKQGEKLEKTLAQLKQEKEQSEQARQLSVEEQVNEAKDNNSDLSHWEANDPDAWDEATKQDLILRQSPKWVNKPYAERFDEVVRRVKAVMPEASAPKKAPTPEDTKATAKAKLAAAPARKPTTLSDIQAGVDPAQESEQFANLTPGQLAAKLMTMPEHKQRAMRAELIKD